LSDLALKLAKNLAIDGLGEPCRYPNVYGTISDTDCVSEKPLLDDFGHSFLVQVQLIILF
jgi:hypothetical protein